MKTKTTLIAILISLAFSLTDCSKDDTPQQTNPDCQNDQSKRSGAKCNDGTESTATGSGACSGHGGVAYWLCK